MKYFLLILIVGLLMRVYALNVGLLEFYPSRQVQTAEIAKNFFEYDFSIVNPVVKYEGPSYAPFLIEFPRI